MLPKHWPEFIWINIYRAVTSYGSLGVSHPLPSSTICHIQRTMISFPWCWSIRYHLRDLLLHNKQKTVKSITFQISKTWCLNLFTVLTLQSTRHPRYTPSMKKRRIWNRNCTKWNIFAAIIWKVCSPSLQPLNPQPLPEERGHKN